MAATSRDIELMRNTSKMAKTGQAWWVEMADGRVFNAVIRTLDKIGFDAHYIRLAGEWGIYLKGTKLSTWFIYNQFADGIPSIQNVVVHPHGGVDFPRLLDLLSEDPSMDDVIALWESVRGQSRPGSP